MKKFVAYFRVSTDRQGKSGLGLEGQRTAVLQHVGAAGELIADYTEIETGKRDSLDNRPELRRALAHARRSQATLVVAKLDRLTRSVAVTSLLHQSNVDFVCCDNPFANRLTIQILAAVAEDEARRIYERTKVALAAYKARGGLLGATRPESRNLSIAARKRGALASAIRRGTLMAEAYEDIASGMHELRSSGRSLRAIAQTLNDDGHTTRRGRLWNATQVSRVLQADEPCVCGHSKLLHATVGDHRCVVAYGEPRHRHNARLVDPSTRRGPAGRCDCDHFRGLS